MRRICSGLAAIQKPYFLFFPTLLPSLFLVCRAGDKCESQEERTGNSLSLHGSPLKENNKPALLAEVGAYPADQVVGETSRPVYAILEVVFL
jgi:hypothetical protein